MFTQGKWVASKQFVNVDEKTIVKCYAYPTFPENIKEAEDNAKLIAAAPDLLKALEIAMYEVRDWHEYNYNQIDSFDNNGTNNERDMQADVANGIYEKLQIIKTAMAKAVNG